MLKIPWTPQARVRPSTRLSQRDWKTGSVGSGSTGPNPCMPPMSWMPFILVWIALWQKPGELLGLAQHRIVAGVQLVPGALQPLGGAPLVRLGRVRGAATADHGRRPTLVPEVAELHRRLERGDRMRRVSREGPGACVGIEIGEQPLLGVGAIGAGRDRGRLVGRHALDDV